MSKAADSLFLRAKHNHPAEEQILTSNKHDYDRIKLFDGGVWSNIAEPNAGESRENKIHTRNISRLKIH